MVALGKGELSLVFEGWSKEMPGYSNLLVWIKGPNEWNKTGGNDHV